MADDTHLAAIRQEVDEFICDYAESYPSSRILALVRTMLAQLDAQAQTIATLTQERDEARDRIAFYEQHTDKQANELVCALLDRDKWLKAFNRSEQFQSGPTKRAEAAEARLTRLTEGLRAVLGHLDGTTSEVDAVAILQALLAAPESPTTPER